MSSDSLLDRRRRSLANADYYFYDDPLHLVKGQGIWLWDKSGNKYLDCYNNVASVGHAHPRVVEALTRQASTLNTHTRYLHENIVEAAETLIGKMPEGMDGVAFVCTGTEANDYAVQIARRLTGKRGVIVTEASYHGNSALVKQLSTCNVPAHERESFVEAIEPPNTYRGPFREGEHDNLSDSYAGLVDDAITALNDRGEGVAAVMIDSSYDSNGILNPPEGYVADKAARVRAAGGIVIMDEVQAGYGRLGSGWWGFDKYGVDPDIVTLGKPMGAGHPVAAVVIKRELLKQLWDDKDFSYFNTFGGNPVSTLVAKTVIDIIDDEGLIENASNVGKYLEEGLRDLYDRHACIGHVQGAGLFWGLDMVKSRDSREPMHEDELRTLSSKILDHGVIMASTGRYENILKIRPPLVFSKENADLAVSAIDKVLKTL